MPKATYARLPTILGLAALLAGTAFAGSHMSEDVEKAIEARHAHMQLYSFNLSTLGGMAQDKISYDATAAAQAANNLAALAAMDQTAYWVDGSDSSLEESRAKPEIWTDSAGFAEQVDALATASADLAAIAGTDLASLKAAFGPVGQSCGGCHRNYRVRNN